MTLLQALRDELVPVIIVVSLLALYSYEVIAAGDPPGDLKTLVATVVAFYFGKAVTRQTAADARQSAAEIRGGAIKLVETTAGAISGNPANGGAH